MTESDALRLTTIDDVLGLEEDTRADFIQGQVEIRAQPSVPHEETVDGIFAEVRPCFHGPRRPDGQGGWWLFTSVLIRFGTGEALCPDIAGWRRSRVPEKPTMHPVTVHPDWVCEVSFSSRKKDSVTVPALLEANGVPWYWRADVEAACLYVYELSEKGYVQRAVLFREDGLRRIPPFDAVELSVPLLFGDDPEL